jgi:undecaprenyl-diphosphatase
MSVFQAAAFGVVQGITEFLPISSSAHLLLLPWFFGWPDPGLAFDVALHWGTLLGVVVYYRRDCAQMLKTIFSNSLLWKIAFATLPAVVAGVLVKDLAETAFRSPWITAGTLSGVGLLLYFADRTGRGSDTLDQLSWKKALAVGCFQALALVPGVSRSGITMSAALLFGLDRSAAVRLSFLLSIPVTLGAGLLKIGYLTNNLGNPAVITAIVASALAGFSAIHFLVMFVRNKSFTPFVVYRLLLAGVIVWFLLK